jgi:cytochrome P450
MSGSPQLSLHNPPPPVTRGSLLQFQNDPLACMKRLHREHGDLAVLEDGDQRLVFTFAPDFNREVLSNTDVYASRFFAVRGNRQSAQRRVTSGLLSQNGAEHRDARRMMKEVFAKTFLPQYHGTICRMAGELADSWQVGSDCDLNSEMVHFMLKVTAALLFGLNDSAFALRLGRLIDRWVHRNHEIGMGALVSAPRFAQGYDDLLLQAEELEQSVKELLARQRNQPQDQINVLNLLFKAQQSELHLDDEKLTGHATLLFAAAHLTTAHTFSWTLFLLAQHPEVQARVQQELLTKMAGPVPTMAELDQLTYLDHVLRESMRVLPASSYSQRIVVEPTVLGSVRMNPGTPVIFSQYITHHRGDLYEQPEQFRPERWQSITPGPYEYLPFGAGPRMCIGAGMALLELRVALATILRRYTIQMQAHSTVNGAVVSTMLGPTSSVAATLMPFGATSQCVPVAGSIHDLLDLPVQARPRLQPLSRAA